MKPVIIIHGGAGDIGTDRILGKITGVKLAAKTGYDLLKVGKSALDACEAAVKTMEDDEYFNAGYGSVLTLNGKCQMEASIMDGKDLNCGAVTLLSDIQYPVSLARRILEKTPHNFLGGVGAETFATEQKIPRKDPESFITEDSKKALEQFKKTGYVRTELGDTVGAVALDSNGNVAAATSTGGKSGKWFGRIGDTPLIGCGTYANNDMGGCSTTGDGETIMKWCLAHRICTEMELGRSPQVATQDSLEKMTLRLKNTAGAISLSKTGEIGVYFTSKRMAWAYQQNEEEIHYGIDKEQHETSKC